jgi:hypothetical protein
MLPQKVEGLGGNDRVTGNTCRTVGSAHSVLGAAVGEDDSS